MQTVHTTQQQKTHQKMGKISKQTFLQGRQTDGQEIHTEMLNNTNY